MEGGRLKGGCVIEVLLYYYYYYYHYYYYYYYYYYYVTAMGKSKKMTANLISTSLRAT